MAVKEINLVVTEEEADSESMACDQADETRRTGRACIIFKQVIEISIVPVVTEYRTAEFYDKKKGRNVHSAFPCGAADDVNYDESMKAFLFLLNSRCNVSLEKTA